MPLRIDNLQKTIQQLAQVTLERSRTGHLDTARALFRQLEAQALRDKIDQVKERVPWLVARPTNEPPCATFPTPQAPRDYTVAATDGSHIAPDRHSPVQYLVLNVGRVRIRYGARPKALMDSEGAFYFREEELHIEANGQAYPIEGAVLGLWMALRELEVLAELAREVDPPALALRDGSLIFWPLQSEETPLQDYFLPRIRRALRTFHDLGIPVASYISYPGARDLVNAIRVWLCGHCTRANQCGRCEDCRPEDRELCAWLRPVRDRRLLEGVLEPGQRSAIFESTSAILTKYADPDGVDHRVLFFYVNTGGEIGRVEAPAWVMEDAAYRDLVHALVIDQCRRGHGYPPALQEAHEQAVITHDERQMVEHLVEQALARLGISYRRSLKDWSKRVRGV